MAAGLAAEFAALGLFVIPTPANAVFVLPFLAPIVVLCGLALWKGRPWMYLGGGISLSIFPILLLSFSLDSVLIPQLGLVFVAAMLLLLAMLLGLPAGAWVFARRRSAAAPVTAREGLRTRYGLTTLLVSGALFGAILAGEGAYLNATSGGGVTSSSDLTAQAWANITVQNFAFIPGNVSIPVGKVVEVTVINRDNTLHTLTYTVHIGTPDERTYSHNLLPSATTRFTMLIATPGPVHFWCVPHQSMGMVGDFIVA